MISKRKIKQIVFSGANIGSFSRKKLLIALNVVFFVTRLTTMAILSNKGEEYESALQLKSRLESANHDLVQENARNQSMIIISEYAGETLNLHKADIASTHMVSYYTDMDNIAQAE